MEALTCKEILNVLKKLGVSNVSERKNCYREYVAYYILQYRHIESVREEISMEHINKLQKILE